MQRKYFFCTKCDYYVSYGEWLHILDHEDDDPKICAKCGGEMEAKRCSVREGKAPNINKSPYSRPIHSDSLAIHPDQVAEHREKFPNIELDDECRPVFTNSHDHDEYMDKCGVHKRAQRTKVGGEIIAILGEDNAEEDEGREDKEEGTVYEDGLD